MPETDKYSSRKYYFKDDKEACKKSVVYSTTNPRYPLFKQVFFTAADRYDLERYGILYAREVTSGNGSALTFDHVLNTLRYMFDGFKKGVMVVIRKNRMRCFLPFANDAHRWDDISKFLEVPDFLRKNPSVEPDVAKWGMQNCLFKERKNFTEGDQSYAELRFLLKLLLRKRAVPDVVLFFNLRDFPIVRKDHEHPYTAIVPPGFKVKPDLQKPMYPVLSFCTHSDFLDIPVPTSEDVRRVRPHLTFPDRCDDSFRVAIPTTKWEDKVPKAFFRGSTTGCGVSEKDNMRVKVHLLSRQNPDIMDCAVVGVNERIRKPDPSSPIMKPNYIKIIGEPGSFADNVHKSKHKYILNLDGHSRAYRLSAELSYGSVVLLQQSPYRLWFEHLLKPGIHYLPVAHDLSDLVTKIDWCRKNDAECREIAKRASAFYQQFLRESGVLDHLEGVIKSIHRRTRSPLWKAPTPLPRVAVVSIYRDNETHERMRQKDFFVRHICRLPVDVYVVEQSAEHAFNIGALKNVGFRVLKRGYQTVVFTDIDMLPSHEILEKGWFLPRRGVACLAANGTRYTLGEHHRDFLFLGGMIAVDPETFEKANGYPSQYYGWGGEDTALAIRMSISEATFYIPKEGFVVDNELTPQGRLKDIKEKVDEAKGAMNMSYWESISNEPRLWRASGVSNEVFDIISDKQVMTNYRHIVVRLPGPPPSSGSTRSDAKDTYKATRRKYTTVSGNKVVWF